MNKNTQNTRRSLRRNRPASSSNEAGPLRQISLMEAAELHKQWDTNDASAKAIHQKVGEMIAMDCQPISVVESSFKALIHALTPKYLIPSTKYLAETVIPNIAQGIRAEVQAKLQEGADYISFTTDVWSSDVNSDSLLGLTEEMCTKSTGTEFYLNMQKHYNSYKGTTHFMLTSMD